MTFAYCIGLGAWAIVPFFRESGKLHRGRLIRFQEDDKRANDALTRFVNGDYDDFVPPNSEALCGQQLTPPLGCRILDLVIIEDLAVAFGTTAKDDWAIFPYVRDKNRHYVCDKAIVFDDRGLFEWQPALERFCSDDYPDFDNQHNLVDDHLVFGYNTIFGTHTQNYKDDT